MCWRSRIAVGLFVAGFVPVAALAADEPASPKVEAAPTILKAAETPIDLGTALRLAGVENPELFFARQRVTETVALRQLAAAQLLPNLNIGTNYDLHRGPLQQAPGDVISVHRDALYYGLGSNVISAGTVNIPGLNYNLNVGDAWFTFLAARQRVAVARNVAEAVRNDVLLRVCLAYTDLLRADARRAIATKNREEATELSRITTAFADAGQGRKADADRATVELQRRNAELAQAEADTLTATARLCQLLNLDPSTRLKPIDGWVVPAPLVPDPTPLPDLLAIALMQRPELAARRNEVRTALYEFSNAKLLPFSPNVILGFSAGDFGGGSNLAADLGRPRFGDFGSRSDLDVIVFWQFRNLGLGNVALARAADSRVKQTQMRELETLNFVRTQVAEAHAIMKAGLPQMEAAEKAVKASTEAFAQDLTRIKGGQGLPLEAVDSMRLLNRSRYEYLDAIIEYNRSHFQLWVALGRPPANALARPVPAAFAPRPIEVLPGPRILPIPKAMPLVKP